MRFIFRITVVLAIGLHSTLYSQTKLYSHKVIVADTLKTSNYIYLHVKEIINDKDSLQWLALPIFDPKIGEAYYYESGLQMGEFHSKELDRTFSDILFLGNLSTSPEVSEKNLVPPLPDLAEDTIQKKEAIIPSHFVIVKEVLQTSGYTYLRVKEGDKEDWLAAVKIPASVGQTYAYEDAAPMTNFTSRELKRTFKEVLLVAKLKLSNEQENKINQQSTSKDTDFSDRQKRYPNKEKKAENSETQPGEISIAKLFENKDSYDGKVIRVKGEVTKYSSDILNKNWIHIKDGTAFSGKSELTVTTNQEAKVGDVITVEGKISLNKDLGSGYFFDVILEEAKLPKN
jgi:hypothetical protein